MRIDPFGDAGLCGDVPDDLADALPTVAIGKWSLAALPALGQRTDTPGVDVKSERLGQFLADRHLVAFRSFAAQDDDDALRQTDILDAKTRELGNPQAGFQQCLKQQPRCAARLVGIIDEGQFLLDRQPVDRGSLFWRCGQAGLYPRVFDRRLALVVDPIPDQDGGDGTCGAIDRTHSIY